MATGDIRNNLKILSAEIRSVKTPAAIVNLDGMMSGEADVYLPIYDYLFQWYNTKLANEILRRDLKLPPYKHNKTRFLETMYLVLRELFQWKPPLSTAQFFSTGFAEKKIIMCSNIIKLIKDYSGGMQRAAASHAGSSNSNSLRLKPSTRPPVSGLACAISLTRACRMELKKRSDGGSVAEWVKAHTQLYAAELGDPGFEPHPCPFRSG
ncbi:conserved hypothetical protein [Ixodes scapularis]|uniref:Centrosomal protein of 44 kDa n=1 Tax=Ixodes scapularis TaxID=6945 RepID=B7PYT7_IXOSC|nr:conserved hypothetical protein [Ixodes scapularis]|eukprot:XP_002403830.1 conserved hypothetical protein [Ixodes scapularis]